MKKIFQILAPCLLLLSCSSSSNLSDLERSKLDPPLLILVESGTALESSFDSGVRSDGEKEYGVIIRSSNVEELKSAGIRIGSVFGDVITARVTVNELRKIVSLSSVRAVTAGSKNYPQ